ncbi:MAG: BTAD domain-containing putative transcriptional regulator [Mycobacterium sp.]
MSTTSFLARGMGEEVQGHQARQPLSLRGPVLQLFGGPRVIIDGHPVTPPESGQRLLAWLALQDTAVQRHRVAAELWPRVDRARADGNLRTALWRLHGADLDLVDSDGPELRLRGDVVVDARLLVAWATRIIKGATRSEDLALAPRIEEGLCVLPGWCDEWILMARESLRATVLEALEVLSRRLNAEGRFAEAVEAAVIAVGADPLRESAQDALLSAHLAEGNLVEAHRARDAYCRILDQELGVQLPPLQVSPTAWERGVA